MVMNFKHHMRHVSEKSLSHDKRDEQYHMLNGGISPKIRPFKYIALFDVDYKDFKDETVEQLTEMKIAHTVIESSNGRYWIIADKFKRNRKTMASWLIQFSGVDPNFIKCSELQGFNLRAYPKRGYTPTAISSYGKGSRDYRVFLVAWEKYWNLPHIKWMVQEYTINML